MGSPPAKAKEIIHRNMKYDAAMKEINQERQEQTEEKPNSDQLNRTTSPDDFLSEYGLIDPSGNYYSCSFAGHHTKAHYILKARKESFMISTKPWTNYILTDGRSFGTQIRAEAYSLITEPTDDQRNARSTPLSTT